MCYYFPKLLDLGFSSTIDTFVQVDLRQSLKNISFYFLFFLKHFVVEMHFKHFWNKMDDVFAYFTALNDILDTNTA